MTTHFSPFFTRETYPLLSPSHARLTNRPRSHTHTRRNIEKSACDFFSRVTHADKLLVTPTLRGSIRQTLLKRDDEEEEKRKRKKEGKMARSTATRRVSSPILTPLTPSPKRLNGVTRSLPARLFARSQTHRSPRSSRYDLHLVMTRACHSPRSY